MALSRHPAPLVTATPLMRARSSAKPGSFEREIRNFVLGALLFLLFLTGLLLLAYRNLASFALEEGKERLKAQAVAVAARMSALPATFAFENPRVSALLRTARARQGALYSLEGKRISSASFLPDSDLSPERLTARERPGEGEVTGKATGTGGLEMYSVSVSFEKGTLLIVYDISTLERIETTERILMFVVPASALALVVLVIPFLRRLFQPIDALTATARGADRVLETNHGQRRDEAEGAIATFALTIEELKRRTEQLEELRRQAQERADALAVTAETLVRSHPGGLLVAGAAGQISEANASALSVLGLDRGVLGKDAQQVFEDVPVVARALASGAKGEATLASEFSLGDATLSRRLALTAVPVVDAGGRYLGTILFIEDRTVTRRLERELNLKRELASLGEMSAGIAHEFRNATATILGYARLATRAKDQESLSRHLAAIQREGEHIAKVTGDFLLFARPERMTISTVDLSDLILDVAGEEGVSLAPVETSLAKGPLLVKADSALLRQALVNLLRNAAQSAADGQREPSVQISAFRSDSSTFIAVEDSGAGIPEDVLPKLFLPFFSTKEGGTGLGLAIVAKIATLHGGTIRVEPPARLGGARFVLEIPNRPS